MAGLLQSKKAAPGLARFLGVSQIASPRKLFEWEAQKNFMPWATIGQKPIYLEDKATLAALCDDNFSPRQIVYLPSEAQGRITAEADGNARLISSHVEAAECVFATSAERRTMLVIAQASYHCWRATLDGAPVPLYRANYAFQALEVPSGQHEVRIKYVDSAFEIGALICFAAIITWLVLMGRCMLRQ